MKKALHLFATLVLLCVFSPTLAQQSTTNYATYGDFTLNFDCSNVPYNEVFRIVNHKTKVATVNGVSYPFISDVSFIYIDGVHEGGQAGSGFDGLQFGSSDTTKVFNYNYVIFTKPFAGIDSVKVTMRGSYEGGHFFAGYTTDNKTMTRFYSGSNPDVSPVPATMTEYPFRIVGGAANVTGNLMFKMHSNAKNFYFRVQKIVVNCEVAAVPDYGFTIAYSNLPVDYEASGLTAYALTLNGTTLSATPVTGVVAKNCPVLVKASTAANYPLITSLTETGDDVDTSLRMSDGTITSDGSTYYVLDNGSQGVGFYRLDKFAVVGKGKAYIIVDGAGDFIALPETTGISMTKTDKVNSNAAYNLAGQRVNDSYKGVVIRNGKKYINK